MPIPSEFLLFFAAEREIGERKIKSFYLVEFSDEFGMIFVEINIDDSVTFFASEAVIKRLDGCYLATKNG